MWVPWSKSPARIRTRPPPQPPSRSSSTTTFNNFTDEDNPKTQSFPPQSPLHRPSVSFKDVETLLNCHSLPPQSPIHKYSLSSLKSKSTTASPAHHNQVQPISFKDIHSLLLPDTLAPIRNKPSIFHRVRAWAHRQAQSQAQSPPDGHNRVVIYYTSLRVVRKTFNDCRTVRSILKGYRVKIDERDLSMDGSYVGELQRIIGGNKKGGGTEEDDDLSLPKVFVNGKYLGGVDEIRMLHESGELKKMLQGLPLAEAGVCGVCGGFRFVLCEWCDGSHRVYIEDVGFKGCSKCNENGLIRCHSCTSVVF